MAANIVVTFFDKTLIIPRTGEKTQWKNLDWPFHLELQEMLSLDISWVTCVKMEANTPLLLNHGSQTIDVPPLFRVTYVAQKRFNPHYRGVIAMGTVTGIELMTTTATTTTGLEEAWSIFEKTYGHRVVCMMRLGLGGRSFEIYLGRAQLIETKNDDQRTYTWLPNEIEEKFPSPRTQEDWETHNQEALELTIIRKRIGAPVVVGVMDHDGFQNSRRVLPVFFRKRDQEVQLQFFNLRGGYVESDYMEWPSFSIPKTQRRSLRPTGSVAAGEGQLAMKLTPNMNMIIQFSSKPKDGTIDDDDELVTIKRIVLEVSNYSRTLTQMGDGLPPRTI